MDSQQRTSDPQNQLDEQKESKVNHTEHSDNASSTPFSTGLGCENNSQHIQKVTAEDLLYYMNLVQFEFIGKPKIYHEFLIILRGYTLGRIDALNTSTQVNNLFKDYPEFLDKLLDFHLLLSKLEVQCLDRQNVSEAPVTVPDSTMTHPATLSQNNNTNGSENGDNILDLREHKVEWKSFITLVQALNDKPGNLQKFLSILEEHYMGHIDTMSVPIRLNNMFKEHPEIITKFNNFCSANFKLNMQLCRQKYVSQTPVTVPDLTTAHPATSAPLSSLKDNRSTLNLQRYKENAFSFDNIQKGFNDKPEAFCTAAEVSEEYRSQDNNTSSLEYRSDTRHFQRRSNEDLVNFLYRIIQKFIDNPKLTYTFINIYKAFKSQRINFWIMKRELKDLFREYPEIIIKFDDCFSSLSYKSKVQSGRQEYPSQALIALDPMETTLSQHNDTSSLECGSDIQHSQRINMESRYDYLYQVIQKFNIEPEELSDYIELCDEFMSHRKINFWVLESRLRNLLKEYPELIIKFNDCFSPLSEVQSNENDYLACDTALNLTMKHLNTLSEHNYAHSSKDKSSPQYSPKENNEDVIDFLYLMLQKCNDRPELFYDYIKICKHFVWRQNLECRFFHDEVRNLLEQYPDFITELNDCFFQPYFKSEIKFRPCEECGTKLHSMTTQPAISGQDHHATNVSSPFMAGLSASFAKRPRRNDILNMKEWSDSNNHTGETNSPSCSLTVESSLPSRYAYDSRVNNEQAQNVKFLKQKCRVITKGMRRNAFD